MGAVSVVPGKEDHKRYLEVQKKLYVEVSYVSERATEVYSSCLMIKGNDVWMDVWMKNTISIIHLFRKWLLLSQGKPSHGDVEGHVIVG